MSVGGWSSLDGRSVLVTGGTGFLGRVLSRKVAVAGGALTQLVRKADGGLAGRQVELARWTADGIRETLKGAEFDYVFHLAAYGVHPGARDAGTMMDVNVGVSHALAEVVLAKRALVQAGSSAEYGVKAPGRRLREDDPLETSKLYGASKAAGMLAASAVAASRGQTFVGARLFQFFGAGESAHRLLPSLVTKLREGRRVALSPGTQVRDFLHVSDVADGLMALAEAGAERRGQTIVNLCSGVETSVRSFGEGVADAMGVSRNLLGFGDLEFRPDDVMQVIGDPEKLNAMTEWRAKLSVEEGIAMALEDLGGGR